ncbi:MAG: aminoacyl-tRNA hydrolase [Thermodesulfovibrionales bacterium]|nr:aminoacyl-tRNA hydrolase [Thermodesulfovibrionales bacterium]
MWLVVGLGNPGIKYAQTRHNIGFILVDRLAQSESVAFQHRDRYQIGGCKIDGNDILLLKPLTYMNRSGVAVKEIVSKYSIDKSNIIVCQDDIDLDVGVIKIKKQGSSGGHRGIESIINELSSNQFIRLKIGIGRDVSIPVDEYVLSRFNKEEIEIIDNSLIDAELAIKEIIINGVDKAMNRFNRKRVVDKDR